MNKSIFSELSYKVFRSGDRINLFIGINVIIYLLLNITAVLEFLIRRGSPVADTIQLYLSLPAHFPALLYKPWTLLTYMFTHRSFFHILFNMLWLFWMGRIFMTFLSKRQFTFVYLAGGFAGALFYLACYNLIPAFSNYVTTTVLLGASASVMAVVFATAALVPEYTIQLLLFGGVRLKYLALVYFLLDVFALTGSNAGGSLAHIGGGILGLAFIFSLKRGNDWSKLFQKRSKLKVSHTQNEPKRPVAHPDQETIDRILDKISQSGYDSLSKTEKEQLFKASNKL